MILACIGLAIIALTSCEKIAENRFGFDSDLSGNATGLTLFNVNSLQDKLVLDGTITLTAGSVEVYLTAPDESRPFTRTITGPGTVTISESVDAIPGTWSLRYACDDAAGSIDLHVNIEK